MNRIVARGAMTDMTSIYPWAAVAALLAAAPSPESVSIKTVDYGGLGRAIRDLQGKVVVVDLWETT
jgi:hypothetical protein